LDVVVHVELHAFLRRLDIALPDGVEQRGVLAFSEAVESEST